MAVLVWAVCGPAFDFSEAWQLIINTGATIVTFLMVFLIQQTQNKDGRALHLKPDELLISLKDADESLVDAEQWMKTSFATSLPHALTGHVAIFFRKKPPRTVLPMRRRRSYAFARADLSVVASGANLNKGA